MSIPNFGAGRIKNPDHAILDRNSNPNMDEAAKQDLDRYGTVMFNGRKIQDLTHHVRPAKTEMYQKMATLSGEGMALAKPIARYMQQGVITDAGQQVFKKVAPGATENAFVVGNPDNAAYDVKVEGDQVTIVEEMVFEIKDTKMSSKGFFKAKVTISGKKSDVIGGHWGSLKHEISYTKLTNMPEKAAAAKYPSGFFEPKEVAFSPLKANPASQPNSGGHFVLADASGPLNVSHTSPSLYKHELTRDGGTKVDLPLTEQLNKDLDRTNSFKFRGHTVFGKTSGEGVLEKKRELILGNLMNASENDVEYAEELARFSEQTYRNEIIIRVNDEEKIIEQGMFLQGTDVQNVSYDFAEDEKGAPDFNQFKATSETVFKALDSNDPENTKGFMKAKMEVSGSKEDLMEIRRLSEPLRGLAEFDDLDRRILPKEKREGLPEGTLKDMERMEARREELRPHVEEWRANEAETREQLKQAYTRLTVTTTYTPIVENEAEALNASYPGGY